MTDTPSKNQQQVYCYFMIGAILSLFFYPMILEGRFPYYRDALNIYYPMAEFFKQSIAQGEYPLWNPYISMGFSQWQSPDPNLLYPFNWLFILLPFHWAINWIIFLHHLIAALGVFLWLRFYRLSLLTASLFGLVFSLSGFMLSLHNNHGFMLAYAWIPWCLLAIDQLLKKVSLKHLAILATFGSILILTGRPDILYFFSLYGLVYLIVKSIEAQQFKRPLFWVSLSISTLIAMLIGAVLFNAFLESKNWLTNTLIAGNMQELTAWSLAPIMLVSLTVAGIFGDPQQAISLNHLIGSKAFNYDLFILSIYMGMGTVICLFSSLFNKKHFKLIGVHLGLIVVFTLVSLGHHQPFYTLLYNYLPGIQLFRYPIKAFGLVSLSLCFIAAMGFEYMVKNLPSKRWIVTLSSLYVLSLSGTLYLTTTNSLYSLIAGLTSHTHSVEPQLLTQYNQIMNQALWYAMGLFTIYMTLFMSRNIIPFKINWGYLFAGLILIDLCLSNHGNLWLSTTQDLFKTTSIQSAILSKKELSNRQRIFYQRYFFNNYTPDTYRPELKANPPLRHTHFILDGAHPNQGMSKQFQVLNGYLSPASKYIFPTEILESAQDLEINNPHKIRLMALLSSQYIHIQAPNKKDFHFNPIYYSKTNYFKDYHFYLARLKRTLPRVYTRSKYLFALNPGDAMNILVSGQSKGQTFDPFQQVLLSLHANNQTILKTFIQKQFPEGHFIPQEPVILNAQNNQIDLYVANHKKKFLLLADTYYPGWKAFIDEQEVPILEANLFQRALALKPGMHHIQFKYQPDNFHFGRILSFSGVIILILCLLISNGNQKKAPIIPN